MLRVTGIVLAVSLFTTSCTARQARALEDPSSPTPEPLLPTETPSSSSTPFEVFSPTPDSTSTPTLSPTPAAVSLRAMVSARLLSCRYGPGPEYLYLYALRAGANIKLIGRTDGDNWHWAWVEGRNRCWVNISYLDVDGDWRQLPIVYPGVARLPVSPYYPPTSILSVVRHGNLVTVEWRKIPLKAGDEEDESMQHYIVEAWRCQDGRILFEPLATNYPFMTLLDAPGCAGRSHGRVFVQEKHGFSGPTDIPWPVLQ